VDRKEDLVIPLTKGKSVMIDKVDEHLKNFKWFYQNGYAVKNTHLNGKHKIAFMHHAILGQPINKMEVDHINGNPLDNRRSNLRIISHRQNCLNRRIHRSSGMKSSKYPGVYWHKENKKWVSRFKFRDKYIHVGSFKDEKCAYDAYIDALKAYEENK
jgi:hypothetical protein